MLKMFKKILPMILVVCMLFTPSNVTFAADVPEAGVPEASVPEAIVSYEANDYYTYIVSVKTGKAIQVTGANNAAVTADAEIPSNKGNDLPDKALFQMRKDTVDNNYVSFSSKGNAWRMLKSEKVAEKDIIDSNNELKTAVSGWEAFHLVDQGNGIVAIKDGRLGNYLTVDDDNKLMATATTVSGAAVQFVIVEAKYEPEVEVNAEVYIEHKATGKLVTVDGTNDHSIDVNLAMTEEIPNNAKFTAYYGAFNGAPVINFESKQFPTMWKATGSSVYQIAKQTPGGWESVTMVPQGDGTVAFKNNATGAYISVHDTKMITPFEGTLTDNEKFIMHTVTVPKKVTKINITNVEGSSIALSWDPVVNTIFSGYEVWRADSSEGNYVKVSNETAGTTFTDTGLDFSTTYYYSIHTINGANPAAVGREYYATTLAGNRPETPYGLDIAQDGNNMKLTWEANMEAASYEIYKASSRFAEYSLVGTTAYAEYIDTTPNADKYANYYKVITVNANGKSNESAPMSLEIKTFGDNMIFFAETDKTASIDAEVARIYEIQKNAQFGSGRYALMFKPGNYTATAMMQIGFYTHIAGLGKTPLETKIKNIETPAYLSNNNATCNFWRSAENLSIVDTDNNGDVYFDFKWAVSQAAPLRRMDVGRKSSFDWYYGYASGGFAADSIFHKAAGSYSQQQYYTRNCDLQAGFFGVNWNGFFQGTTGAPENNWELGAGNSNYTNIETTPVIREKPFLYLDNGEYKVFVPSLRKDSTGVTWSEGNIGAGESLSLNQFYIAKPEVDNAATINAALELGKHILLTPGIYYAEEPIVVENADTIVLGIGLATIIPTNEAAAMIVDDVDGVTIAGIIFDAGDYSDNLLLVGEKGSNNDHSANPTLLADLFFRVGGVHGGVATTDVALEINSDDMIGDHFWIWRADHGDGVAWDLNKSSNGLVVNGDDMTMYGLFNEHFQEYVTLWNGNGGRMYFYQNETPYDPQNQDDWMSHEGTVKGYAAYKVANTVDTHYAVGLGIYDVFINTNGASIFMDNAIEVPNKEGVIVENACIVEIANGSGPLVGINSIVDGTGTGISTGIGGIGFRREFILKYQNGVATLMDGTEEGIQPSDLGDPVPEDPEPEDPDPADPDPQVPDPGNPNPGNNNTITPIPTPTPIVEFLDMSGVDGKASLSILKNAGKDALQVKVELPVEQMIKQAAGMQAAEKLPVTIPIFCDTIVSFIKSDMVTKANITVIIPSSLQKDDKIVIENIWLDKDILAAAKNANKDVNISVVDEKGQERYSWTFSGSDLANSKQDISDVNLSLDVKNVKEDKQLLELLAKSNENENMVNSFVINFKHQGILPAQASIRIYVGDMDVKVGETVCLYYYNPLTGKLNTLPYSTKYMIDKDGYITVNLLHCSSYVILPKQVDNSVITSLRNQIRVLPTKRTLYTVETKINNTSIIIILPVTLELVNDLKDKTSSSFVGAAIVSFTSNNEKVATVDSEGKIVAKSKGTAKITTKITLYSGKVLTTTTTITVK